MVAAQRVHQVGVADALGGERLTALEMALDARALLLRFADHYIGHITGFHAVQEIRIGEALIAARIALRHIALHQVHQQQHGDNNADP